MHLIQINSTRRGRVFKIEHSAPVPFQISVDLHQCRRKGSIFLEPVAILEI